MLTTKRERLPSTLDPHRFPCTSSFRATASCNACCSICGVTERSVQRFGATNEFEMSGQNDVDKEEKRENALVERRARLVRRSDLNLHEERTSASALFRAVD